MAENRTEQTPEALSQSGGASSHAGAGDAHGQRVKAIFSDIARRYDLFNALSSFGIYRSWLRRVAKTAACTGTDAVLDVAGGTGDVSFELCAECPPASIELTDFTPQMLEVAKDRIAAGANRGVPVRTREVDAHSLPYNDASFSLVTCAYGLRNFSDRKRAMAEAARVLKPGGRYVVLEFGTPPNRAWRALYSLYLQHMIPFIGGVVTGDRSGFEYLRDSIKGFPPQSAIAAEIVDAGFKSCTYTNCSGGIAAVYEAIK